MAQSTAYKFIRLLESSKRVVIQSIRVTFDMQTRVHVFLDEAAINALRLVTEYLEPTSQLKESTQ